MGTRAEVTRLGMARKSLRHGLKRDIALAKQQIAPGALMSQFKLRTRGKLERKAQDAATLAIGHRKAIALGGLAAVATSLLAYTVKRWKRRHETKNPPAPVPYNANIDGDRL